MKTLTGLLLVFLAAMADCSAEVSGVSMQSQVEQISKDLSENRIGRVEILQIPPRILTRARITPQMLEKQYHNKLIIRDINSNSYKEKLTTSLRTISASSRDEMPDLRWAVIFYSQNDTRVGAVYFDRSGRYGAVNGAGAAFENADLFNWLTATFSNCFQ